MQEIITKYDVDGIHMDDYFYPTTDEALDYELYQRYINTGGNMSLSDFRRYGISSMIAEIYREIKAVDEGVVFGISPDASVDRNRNVHYADVQLWGVKEGYVDYLCPQIYYGFNNESMPFKNVVGQWQSVCVNCEMWVGLAVYKIGAEDIWAGSGSGEWLESANIISQQYELLEESDCAAAVFYRYDSLFRPESAVAALVTVEREKLSVQPEK